MPDAMVPADTYNKIMIVIAKLRDGETLHSACNLAGISRQTVRAHVATDPQLRDLFDEALEDSDDVMAELLVNIDTVHSDPKMAAVISKNIQWLLARKRPGRYGDRLTVTNIGTADQTIVEALKMAMERIPVPPALPAPHPMLDVTPVREPSLAELLGD